MEKFLSGAVRDSRIGKGRFDLISPIGLRRLAHVMEMGAAKYGDRNWEKGMPVERFIDSALRHINQFREGHRDEDHLGHAAFNIFGAMHFTDVRTGNRIFVSGPYSNHHQNTEGVIEVNVNTARQIGADLMQKGWHVIVPHTMGFGFDDPRYVTDPVSYDQFLDWCFAEIRQCDAMFFFGSSHGADMERKLAEGLGLTIYTDMEDVPDRRHG
jgi:hypothetical protein